MANGMGIPKAIERHSQINQRMGLPRWLTEGRPPRPRDGPRPDRNQPEAVQVPSTSCHEVASRRSVGGPGAARAGSETVHKLPGRDPEAFWNGPEAA